MLAENADDSVNPYYSIAKMEPCTLDDIMSLYRDARSVELREKQNMLEYLEELEERLNRAFPRVSKDMKTNANAIAALTTRVNDLRDKTSSDITEVKNEVNSRFQEFERRIDARFQEQERRIDARFQEFEEKIDARFQNLEQTTEELKTNIDQMSKSISHILSKLDETIELNKARSKVEPVIRAMYEKAKEVYDSPPVTGSPVLEQ